MEQSLIQRRAEVHVIRNPQSGSDDQRQRYFDSSGDQRNSPNERAHFQLADRTYFCLGEDALPEPQPSHREKRQQ